MKTILMHLAKGLVYENTGNILIENRISHFYFAYFMHTSG